MKRMNLPEMLEGVRRRLATKFWAYSYKPHDWFFPSDLSPHNNSFKYQCRKLYQAGILERRGDSRNRWGYSYRVPIATPKKSKEG